MSKSMNKIINIIIIRLINELGGRDFLCRLTLHKPSSIPWTFSHHTYATYTCVITLSQPHPPCIISHKILYSESSMYPCYIQWFRSSRPSLHHPWSDMISLLSVSFLPPRTACRSPIRIDPRGSSGYGELGWHSWRAHRGIHTRAASVHQRWRHAVPLMASIYSGSALFNKVTPLHHRLSSRPADDTWEILALIVNIYVRAPG